MTMGTLHLGLRSKAIVFYFLTSLNLFSSGFGVFRTQAPDPFRLQIPQKSKSSFERLIEDTTRAFIEPIKTVSRSLLPEGQLSDFLEFVFGQGSTQETARQEAEKLEAKLGAGYRLNSKETFKLELLREELSSVSERPIRCMVPTGAIVVLAPGQELLQNLPQAIRQMANSERSEDQIRRELLQIWNRTNYRNQTRVVELRNLVSELFGRVIDLKSDSVEYTEKLETIGEFTASCLSSSELGLTPDMVVLLFEILDAYLTNSPYFDFDREIFLGVLSGSLYVASCLTHFRLAPVRLFGLSLASLDSEIWNVESVMCHPSLLFSVVTRVEKVWHKRVSGETVPTLKIADRFCCDCSEPRSPQKIEIGRGAWATVYRTECGRMAIKSIKTEISKVDDVEFLLPPVDLFRELLRPNSQWILPIFEVQQLDEEIELWSPYCKGGNLRDGIKSGRTQNSQVSKHCLFQILSGLAVLESYGLIHADLKSHNILISEDHKLVLADFGLTCPDWPGIRDKVVLVTPGYRAPELLFRVGPITSAIDVFSAAVVFWEMLTGRPFLTENSLSRPWDENQLAFMIHMFPFPTEKEYPELFSARGRFGDPIAWKFFISAEEKAKLVSDWKKFSKMITPEGMDLFNKMTKYDPKKRIKASEALKHPFFKDLISPDSTPSAEAAAAAAAANSVPNDGSQSQDH